MRCSPTSNIDYTTWSMVQVNPIYLKCFFRIICLCLFLHFCKFAGRAVIQHSKKHQQRGCRKADGIYRHNRLKCSVQWKYPLYPANTNTAYACHCKNRRNKGNSKSTQIPGHNLIQQTKGMGNHNQHQPNVTNRYDLCIIVKYCKQRLSKEKDAGNGDCQYNRPFHKAKGKRFSAPPQIACTIILSHKSGN